MGKKRVTGNLSELEIPPLNEKQGVVALSLANEIMFGGAVFGGKDIWVETPILTTTGFKCIKDVHPGDYVFDDKGKPTKVVAESEIFTGKDVYEVCFDDGTSIYASATHQWVTQDARERISNSRRTTEYRENRRAKRSKRSIGKRPDLAKMNSERVQVYDDTLRNSIRTTEEISKTLTYKNMTNHSILNTEPIQFESVELPIHPYLLGAWLGDGTRGNSQITSADPELIEYIRSLGYTVNKQNSAKYGYSVSMLNKKLRDLGIATEKRIPDIYKYSSIEDRIELVRGIMDTDGTVGMNGGISIGLSDKPLFDDLVFVLNTLGIKVFTKVKKAYLYGERKRDSYIASFRPKFRCFNLSRKVVRLSDKNRPTSFCRYIKDVKLVESVPTKCIQVESESHMFLAGEQLVPTHNSHLLRVASIIYASMVPGINIYLFRRLTRDLVLNHLHGAYSYHTLLQPWIESGYVQIINSAPHEIRFGNGSRIFLNHCQYLHNVYSFQGAEIHCLLIDEATHFLPEMYQFLRSRVRLGGLKIDFQNVTDIFNSMLESWGLDARFTIKQMRNYFPKIILGTNPGNVGHTYFKEHFVDAYTPYKIWKTPKEEGGMYRQFIPAVYSDNEYGMKLDPNYIDRVRGLSDPNMAQAMIEGDWNIISGGAISDAWDESIHFIEPFEIPETWYIDRAHDWGSAAPFVTVWFAESNGDSVKLKDGSIVNYPPGTLFIIDEQYGGKTDDLSKGLELSSFEIGERIAKKELAMGISERIKPGPADSSIFDLTKFRDHYTSIHDEIKNGYNSIYYKEKKRKRGEIFIPADKSPGTRIRGLEVFRTLLKNAKKEILEDKGLFVFNKCIFFKKTVPNLQRSQKNPEDVDTDSVDHYYDAVRYRVLNKKVAIRQLSNFL